MKSFADFVRKPLTIRLGIYFGALLAIAVLAYFRYPTYLQQPNFYAEDGSVFAANILNHGFLHALFTMFTGYLVVGIYLLEGVGFLINHLFLGGSTTTLPTALGITSYIFWGFLCTLPILLFWNTVKHRAWLVVLAVTLSLLPLPGSNYAILGTIGNYKFAFLFIAFLLCIKRAQVLKNRAAIYAIDALFVICALTNASAYLLVPVIALSYLPKQKQSVRLCIRRVVRDRTFLSFVGACILLVSQLIYIVLQGGISKMPGYLDQAYQWPKTVEVIIHRTILFPFDFVFMKHLNDIAVVLGAAILVYTLYHFAQRTERHTVSIGLYAILSSTILFVSQRTGVTAYFSHYQASGPDQFFYTQNMIILFVAFWIVANGVQQKKSWRSSNSQQTYRRIFIILLALLPIAFITHNDFNRSSLMNRSIGSFPYAVQQTCKLPNNHNRLSVPVYPLGAQFIQLQRNDYCSAPAIKNYIPTRQPILTVPANNQYIPVNGPKLTQTFTASYNDLSGISVFFSTFGQSSNSTYQLTVYDKTCRVIVRQTAFSANHIHDNSYYDIYFKQLTDSRNKMLCFTVTPIKLEVNKPAIAVQLSAPDIYLQGATRKDRAVLGEDLVFDLLYR
jgi:hypothetical protein